MAINKTTVQIVAVILLAAALRFMALGLNPPSPYWEEAALGYDAYSILKTGKDFHGNAFPLTAFESFGDYKPSLYFYAAVPSVAAFGLNTFAVRFPSAFFGTLSVLFLFLLLKTILPKKLELIATLAALFLAISPWHILISRVGFEANLGLFLLIFGAWFWQKRLLIPAVTSLVAAMYAYHANRVLVPLLGIGWGFLNWRRLLKLWQLSLTAVIVAVILVLPLLGKLNTSEIKQRFYETSAFSDLAPIIKSNLLISEDGGSVIAKLRHHRYWQYLGLAVANYADHFSAQFLFLSGDNNPRHSIQTSGQLYLIFLPAILLGGWYLYGASKPAFNWLLLWLVLSPIPAALTKATPHALRSLPLVLPMIALAAAGLVYLMGKRRLVAMGVALILLFEFGRFWYSYQRQYPINYSGQWQYGYQELVSFINDHYDQYDQIYVTRALGRPSIYYWFYSKTDPNLVQAANSLVPKDQGEYLAFDKLTFGNPPAQLSPRSLVVSALPLNNYGNLVLTVNDLSNQPVFYAYEIK